MLEELLGKRIESMAEVSTVSGLITQRLGRFPCAGDKVIVSGWELFVAELCGTRVLWVKIDRRGRPGEQRPKGHNRPSVAAAANKQLQNAA